MKPDNAEVKKLVGYLRSLHGSTFKKLEIEAKKLADYIGGLIKKGRFQLIDATQPSKHVGGVLTDAVLQVRYRYETHVRPRVEHIADNYPQAATVSGLLRLLDNKGAKKLICWKGKKEQGRLSNAAVFFYSQGIETFSDLYEWLKSDWESTQPEKNRDSLKMLDGVADKAADYYRELVRHWDALAVDRFMGRELLDHAGIDSKKYVYKEKRTIYQLAAIQMETRPVDLDSSIYYSYYMRSSLPQAHSKGRKYCVECCARIRRTDKFCPKCGTQQR